MRACRNAARNHRKKKRPRPIRTQPTWRRSRWPESEYQAITLLGAASPFGEPLNWRIVPITKRTTYKTPPSAAQRSSPRVDLSTAADIGVRFLTQRRTPRKYELEELLELHR